jgi:hypothetical protein
MSEDRVSLRDIMNINEKTQKDIAGLRLEFNQEMRSIKGDIRDLQDFKSKTLTVVGLLSGVVTLSVNFIWNKVIENQ